MSLADDINRILDADCDETRVALYNPRATVAAIRKRVEAEGESAEARGRRALAERDMALALETIKRALALYATSYAVHFEGPLGDDGPLGDSWLELAHGLVGLLNGPTAGIDCGHFDGSVRRLVAQFGFSPYEVENLSSESV